jgi:hypothetical protein
VPLAKFINSLPVGGADWGRYKDVGWVKRLFKNVTSAGRTRLEGAKKRGFTKK